MPTPEVAATQPLVAPIASPLVPSPQVSSAPSAAEPAESRPKDNHLTPAAAPTAVITRSEPVAPIPAPGVHPDVAPVVPAGGTPEPDNAIIIFTNTPGEHCGTCETVKISVAPSGKMLIEHGGWDSDHRNWRYWRTVADVGPARAAAFAASLKADRPTGEQVLASGATCSAPTTQDDGLRIEWLAAQRHDLLTAKFNCPAQRDSQLADRLRHAPDLLGLRQLRFPWGSGR